MVKLALWRQEKWSNCNEGIEINEGVQQSVRLRVSFALTEHRSFHY